MATIAVNVRQNARSTARGLVASDKSGVDESAGMSVMGDGSARGETRRARDSGDGTCAPTPSDAPDAPAACAPAHGKHPVSDDDDWATPPPDGDERSDDDDTTIGAVATRFVGPGRRAAVLESETDTPSFRVNDLRSTCVQTPRYLRVWVRDVRETLGGSVKGRFMSVFLCFDGRVVAAAGVEGEC